MVIKSVEFFYRPCDFVYMRVNMVLSSTVMQLLYLATLHEFYFCFVILWKTIGKQPTWLRFLQPWKIVFVYA